MNIPTTDIDINKIENVIMENNKVIEDAEKTLQAYYDSTPFDYQSPATREHDNKEIQKKKTQSKMVSIIIFKSMELV
jgi:hypothetical protein